MLLKPLKTVTRVNIDFWTLDIETESLEGKKFVVGCIYRPKKRESESYTLFHNAKEILTFLRSYSEGRQELNSQKRGKYKNIFISHLTFDVRFLLEAATKEGFDCEIQHLAAGSNDLVTIFIFNGFAFRFIDTVQLTQMGQEKLEHALLGKGIKWTDIEFRKDTPMEDYIRRVKSDVCGLYHAMCAYFRLLQEAFSISANGKDLISLSRLALKAFRTGFVPKGIYNPFLIFTRGKYVAINQDVMDLIYKSYFGGRTELYQQGIFDNVYCADINSLYPYVFDNSYPMGKFWTRNITSAESLDHCLYHFDGFFVGSLVETHSDLPILPSKDPENRTIFGFGKKTGVWPFPELRYARGLDLLNIKYPTKCILFKKGNFFQDFGQQCYEQRLHFKETSSPLEYPFKIIMNSLYGKFGQKREQNSQKYLSHQEYYDLQVGNRPISDFISDGTNYYELQEIGTNPGIGVIKFNRIGIKPFYLPHISSYVTSYARIKLHKALVANYPDLLYCDTDSVWCMGIPKVLYGEKMGQWKLEYPETIENKSKGGTGAFITLKCYAFQEEGQDVKVRIKGVSRKQLESAQFSSPRDFYERSRTVIYEEPARYNPIRSSLKRNQSFLSSNVRIKQISGNYSKRKVLLDGRTMAIEV